MAILIYEIRLVKLPLYRVFRSAKLFSAEVLQSERGKRLEVGGGRQNVKLPAHRAGHMLVKVQRWESL